MTGPGKSRSRFSLSEEHVNPETLLLDDLRKGGRLGRAAATASGILPSLTERHSTTTEKALNYTLLISLYFLQGIPLGLVHGTLPYLLKSRGGEELTFTDLGWFSLASYPYSLKLLWSPIVDSYYWPRVGRRKSWIIPTQLLIGLGFLWISGRVEPWINHVDSDIGKMTIVFTLFILLCATQDIAVDGWALTLLDPDRVHFSSTCQTIGLHSGFFASFTVFLALNSAEFCSKYLGMATTGAGVGLITISSFLRFWGSVSILGTLAVAFMKRESMALQQFVPKDIVGAYSTIYRIMSLPNVRKLAIVLLICRIGFIALDSIVALKLIERGFPTEKLALTALIDFPCQIIIGFGAARLAQGSQPLWGWQRAIFFKTLMAVAAMPILAAFPSNGEVTNGYFTLVTLLTVVSSFASTMMFVTMSSFFSIISDPSIGGTYMTFLNTLTNLGGLWPKLVIMSAVDWFTVRHCTEAGCKTTFDGYYLVNTVCVIVGTVMSIFILFPLIRKLEMLPNRAWHINSIPSHLHGLV